MLFTNEYGDIDEPFYNSMESMYESVLALIAQHDPDDYGARYRHIVSATPEGWGFAEGLSALYHRYFDAHEGIT